MENYVKFSYIKSKQSGKETLIISCNDLTPARARLYADEALEKYKQYLLKHNNFRVIINSTGMVGLTSEQVDYGNLMDKVQKLCKLDELAKKKVKCTAIILNNSLIKDCINFATNVMPFVVPTKLFSNYEEAKAYVNKF